MIISKYITINDTIIDTTNITSVTYIPETGPTDEYDYNSRMCVVFNNGYTVSIHCTEKQYNDLRIHLGAFFI
jgi:hypothetical protein